MTEDPDRDAGRGGDGHGAEDDGGPTGGEGPFEWLPEDDGGPTGGEDPFEWLPEADGEDPFERLDDGAALGERTPADAADPFEEVDVGSTDGATWEELVSPPGTTDPTAPTDGVDPTTVGETVVPKRGYCQGCEYLAAPPDVACTHPDGEILEAVDLEHFRVRNCPVVAHRRERSVFGDVGSASDD